MYHICANWLFNSYFNQVVIDRNINSSQNCPKFDIVIKIALFLQYLESDRPAPFCPIDFVAGHNYLVFQKIYFSFKIFARCDSLIRSTGVCRGGCVCVVVGGMAVWGVVVWGCVCVCVCVWCVCLYGNTTCISNLRTVILQNVNYPMLMNQMDGMTFHDKMTGLKQWEELLGYCLYH